MAALAAFFHHAGDEKFGRGFLVGGISVLLWIVTAFYLGWGWLGSLAGQLFLFGLLTVINPPRSMRR